MALAANAGSDVVVKGSDDITLVLEKVDSSVVCCVINEHGKVALAAGGGSWHQATDVSVDECVQFGLLRGRTFANGRAHLLGLNADLTLGELLA